MGRRQSKFLENVLGEQKSLFSFALKLTLDKDRAHDLVQDTTLRALNNEDKFVESSNFKGWIYTIMRNIFLNNCRRFSHEQVMSDDSRDIVELAPCTPDSHTPDSSYSLNEIAEIIASFPEDYRRPFNMHIAGYKYEEISSMLGMPLGTVKSRIFFTRRKLREMLKDYR